MALPVLVTGGCGFVGRHVVLRLLREGRAVWVVDNLSTGRNPQQWLAQAGSAAERCTFIQDDVRSFFRGAAQGTSAHTLPAFGDVYHFAAVVGGRAMIEGDPLAVATDLAIDAECFAWAVRARPKRLLYASSSAVYPVSLQQSAHAAPLREELLSFPGSLGQPDMTYGWSKMTGEYLARIAAQHYGLSVACVRPFSGYGEDQDEAYPVPAIAARAAHREDPFDVWGTGEQGRDFVHIDDCVEAMWRALETITDGSAVNIGSGSLTSFRELIGLFAEFAGYTPVIRPHPEKPAGVFARVAETTRMRSLLGWEPAISLREGMRRVYDAALARTRS